MKVIWSPFAIDCVSDIASYIALDKPKAARQWIDDVFDRVKNLEKFPQIGRIVPDAKRKEIREILFKNYRIIYRIDKEQINILTVRHGKQMLPIDAIEEH